MTAIIDIDVTASRGWHAADVMRAYLAGGATFLQLRAKQASGRDFLDLASEMTALAHEHGAALIVNDRADIAALSAADGVHVGQEDLPPALARRIVGDDVMVGLSTHSVAQVEAAVGLPISYVAIGPVFGTRTKATGYEPIGLELVRAAAERTAAAGLPLVAIGGITLERAREVIAAGAASVAVISDLLAGENPTTRVREYVRLLGQAPP